jgi:multiple sugar transport system permease protein
MPNGEVRRIKKNVSYDKRGYIFIIPFFLIFIIFQMIPLFQTFYYSFFEYYYKLGIVQVGPTRNNFDNYVFLFTESPFWRYLGNTLLLRIIGAIPQFGLALLFAVWFTDARLKLKFQGFFKAVVYMPNLIMAAAFGYLFFLLTSTNGPINLLLQQWGWVGDDFDFRASVRWVRIIIAFINVLMWTGNTTILLMSGIMGIDESIFESARLDGAGAFRTFWSITMPLLMPIFVYVFITSMIGGIQLFDAAQIYTQTTGGPSLTSYTVIMYLYNLIAYSRNYGIAGALSVVLFIITAILSIFVFKLLTPVYNAAKQENKAKMKRKIRISFNNKHFGESMLYETRDNIK